MSKIQIKNEEPVREVVCKCDQSLHGHDMVWGLIVVFVVMVTGAIVFFLTEERNSLKQLVISELQQKESQPQVQPENTAVTVPDVDVSVGEPAIRRLDWVDLSLWYPADWFAVSQSYQVHENEKEGFVLTLNPSLIDFPTTIYLQPFYLRIARWRSGSKSVEGTLNDARERFTQFEEKLVNLQDGMVLHDIYGQQKLSGTSGVFAHDYYVVIKGGDNLDRYGQEEAIIYHFEPKTPTHVTEWETYDVVIEEVEKIVSSLRRYQYK